MTGSATGGGGSDDGKDRGSDEPWTVLRLVRWSADYLAGKGVGGSDARLDAEHLLAHALGTTRLELYLQFERPLTPEELAGYRPLLLRRGRREPLQYILGRGAFRELDLRVDPRVLIPRPETEELVEAVLEWARARAGVPAPSGGTAGNRVTLPWSSEEAATAPAEGEPPGPREAGEPVGPGRGPGAGVDAGPSGRGRTERTLTALDVGTGSGCIALSLALEGPFERVVATDVSADALDLAAENARQAGLGERVVFRLGPLFEPVSGETYDVVVSNPPYVAREEAGGLAPEVREHEPPGALFAGPGGLEVLTVVVDSAPEHVAPGGLLALEVGPGQASAVADRIRRTGVFGEPEVRRDLAGRPRIVLAEREGS